MKIAPKSIEAYLAKPDPQHRAALLYGPDAGLARLRAKALAKAALGTGAEVIELTEAALLADPALLADELSAMGLLASKRVIVIGDAGDKLTKIISAAAAFLHADAFLVVCSGELSPRSSLRAWFEKESACAAIACYHDEARDVQAVVRRALDAAGIRMEAGVVEYLSQQLGNDRGVTQQEIDKLITYAGAGGQVSLADAQALVDYNRETGFDDLVNAMADRNVAALDTMLALLLREGNAPVAYLRALQRYFNRLYAIRSQMQSGQSAEQVIGALKPPVFFRQVPIMTRHAQHWDIAQIARALELLAAAELATKSSDLPIVPASTRKLLQVTQVR